MWAWHREVPRRHRVIVKVVSFKCCHVRMSVAHMLPKAFGQARSRIGSPSSYLEADCERGRNQVYKAAGCRTVKQVSRVISTVHSNTREAYLLDSLCPCVFVSRPPATRPASGATPLHHGSVHNLDSGHFIAEDCRELAEL
jgi:hypothetical protein